MKLKLHLISLFFITALVVFSAAHVFTQAQTDIAGPYASHPDILELNDKIKEKEDEINSLEEATKLYERRIQEASNQSVTLNSQLNLLDNQITKIELDIKTTQATIDKAKLEIDAAQFQIDKEQAEIDAQKDKLYEYIKLINKEDQRTMLEILILNESFSEFFNQLNYSEEIQADLKSSVDRLKLLKETSEVKKANLEIYQDSMEAAKEKLEQDQLHLKEQIIAKEQILYETKRSEIKYQNLLEEARAIKNEVDESIDNIKDEIQRKVERLSSGNTNPNTTLIYWPIDPSRGITTYFNDPEYPFRYLFEHSAIDIRAYQGTRIVAPADAYVARAMDNGYGYSYITLVHDNGLSTVYGHVSGIYVSQDQFVQAGQVIGLTGGQPGTLGAGRLTTGAHLHFEVRLNGIPIDPLQYLP